jgi:hypothetical protein
LVDAAARRIASGTTTKSRPNLMSTTGPNPPAGQLFSRLYIKRGAPTQDSQLFRNRLSGYLEAKHYPDYRDIAKYLQQEAGLIVVSMWVEKSGYAYFDFPKFFTETKIEFVLDSITLIWQFLKGKYTIERTSRAPKADAWHEFVARAFRQENISYSLDDLCGVHYFVDEEFERNRVSVLRAAGAPRYAAVRHAFESAHSYLDAQPPDTKASVRSMFEAIEILARLMDANSNNLNKWQVENKLKPQVLSKINDLTEKAALSKLLDGVADWVDALHIYRHGQGVQEPVNPSLETAVYVLSSGAATLRLLLGTDSATGPST